MYVKCGTQTRTIYVSISSLVGAVGGKLCKCLIGMHGFTGCDTVSAFAGGGEICKFYCSQPGTDNINELRYRLFCAKKGNIDSTQLPPHADCLLKHASRENFQAVIWKRSLQHCPLTPTPSGSGWREGGDNFAIDWMSGDPAPTAVLELLSCSCARSCQLPTYCCLENGLKCTDVWKLLDYGNRCEDSIEEVVSDDSDKDEEI